MQCRYDVDDGCENEAAKGSTYCALHPLDDFDFFMRALGDPECPRCGRPVPEGFFKHGCPER